MSVSCMTILFKSLAYHHIEHEASVTSICVNMEQHGWNMAQQELEC